MSSTALFLIVMSIIVEFPDIHAHPAKTLHPWPIDCVGRSYCHKRPIYYPRKNVTKLLEDMELNYMLGNVDPQDRTEDDDVASCQKIHESRIIYLIKDKNDQIRFVPQSDKFKIRVTVEECRKPGRVNRSEYLRAFQLRKHRVDCTETMVSFQFPVLTLDQEAFESVALKDGISLSCSAKMVKPKTYW